MFNPFKQFRDGDTSLFKGGGTPPPAPTPVPPVTSTSRDVLQASRQARVDAKKRRGLASTLFAGETGGFQGPNISAGVINKNLLG
jgi:hypothetical protein